MNRRFDFVLCLSLMVLACGGGSESLDSEGLASNETAFEQFTRASQLYYRGRLTSALDEFNGVIYRYPDSPLASDARLAVRRVESDLAGEEQEPNTDILSFNSRVAIVGRPGVVSAVHEVSSSLRTIGAGVTEIIDDQAPALTVVFYGQGFSSEASLIADSLGIWLSHPENIAFRPGDELISAVADGFDVLVILGSDAVFASTLR